MNESHLYLDLQELRARANRRWFWSRFRLFAGVVVLAVVAYYAVALLVLFCQTKGIIP